MNNVYQPLHKDSISSLESYALTVILKEIPKLAIIVFSIIITTYTVELTYVSTDDDISINIPHGICYKTPDSLSSGHGICHNGLAAAVSSIFVCMMLLLLDASTPCMRHKFKSLADAFSLMCSTIMATFLLVTSSSLASLYHKSCNWLNEDDIVCNGDEIKFLVLPVFGYLNAIGWCIIAINSCLALMKNSKMNLKKLFTYWYSM